MDYHPPVFTILPGGAKVYVRAGRPLGMLVFLCFWLTFWTLGGLAAGGDFLSSLTSPTRPPNWFAGGWLLLWVPFEGLAALALLRMLAGHETLTLAGGTLRLAWRNGPFRGERTYDTSRIEHLRAEDGSLPHPTQPRQRRDGGVFFDYRGRAVSFGSDLPLAECERVVAFLRAQGVAAPPTAWPAYIPDNLQP